MLGSTQIYSGRYAIRRSDSKDKVPPGPQNPLGKHWLGLSVTALGIHGTTAPASIYQFQSHGCVRLHPEDIAALYEQVRRGETGSIIYMPTLLAEFKGKVFLEVHPDVYHQTDTPLDTVKIMAEKLTLSTKINWLRALQVVERYEGLAL